MALSSSRLKDDLKTKIQALLDVKDSNLLNDVCQAIADAVVTEITSNAIVPSGIAVQVNPGSGTGATTGTGTVS